LPGLAQSTKPPIIVDKHFLAQAAEEQLEARWKEFLAGKTTVDFVLTASNDLLRMELAAADTKMAKIAVCEAHVRKTENMFNGAKSRFEAGVVTVTPLAQIREHLEDLKAQLNQFRSAK
jgi:outer membrane protein TolC